MGFWDSLGDVTGWNQADLANDQANRAKTLQSAGAETMGAATQKASGISDITPEQYAAAAGKSGAALGEQMGSQAADVGTQKAIQAARTAGLNKGESAITGATTAGRNFASGQTTGELAGMEAYGGGAQNQLNATNVMGTTGANMGREGSNEMGNSLNASAQGNQAAGSVMSAIGAIAPIALALLDKGGVVTKPTAAVVGEKGPEVVLPLNDPKRIEEILKKIGLVKGAAEVKEKMEACPTCGQPRKSKEPAKEPVNE